MDCIKPPSDPNRRKFSRAFSRCIHPQTPSPSPKLRTLSEELNISLKDFKSTQKSTLQRDLKDALLAKIFASLSSIKAAYAELQCAQFPYNSAAVQAADEALVSELMVVSELKQRFLGRSLDLPPTHVTQLLAEIQEQQSNIKTYEITMKQLEGKVQQKEGQICELKTRLDDIVKGNRLMEKKLNSSGVFPLLGSNLGVVDLNHCHFISVLQYTLRSIRHFVKNLVREMESKSWDIDLAAKAIEPNVNFSNPKHRVFAFESFVCRLMFDGFNHPGFLVLDETKQDKKHFFSRFQKLEQSGASQVLSHHPQCKFAKFCRQKYLKLVHPKMECSFFGNLDQRKIIGSGAFPRTEFFGAFAEMAKRMWLLHCLAFSYEPPTAAFQVKKGCRYSEVYMESVAVTEGDVVSGGFPVAFTVVPGFKIGKTVVQSQVYLSPATS